jgi:myo-inositol-1(or 4)-monophosphatase
MELAQRAARKAGQTIINRRENPVVNSKSSHNLVTDADYSAQEIIIDTIREKYSDHHFIAEENQISSYYDADNLWIIDPLDGTNNFAHNIPHFSISIAYARLGRVEAGVVLDPLRDEMFTAVRGKGAFLNGNQITVSTNKTLQQSIIATGFYYDRGLLMRKTLQSIEKLFEHNVHGIRRFGSAALDLCWVACGRFDAYFEYMLSPWDFAAGMLIVQEAGGCCTDSYNNNLVLNSQGIAASNNLLHESFLEVVSLA